MPSFIQLLPAMALPARLEPYKKLLGVLVRQNCISIAVSNPYLNLAEPIGAVMLREGRLPRRSFQRLLSEQQQQLAGFVLAYEVPDEALQQHIHEVPQTGPTQQQDSQQQLAQVAITQQQEAAAAQVQAALQSMRPGLTAGWYGPWSAQVVGASCRVAPPAGPAAAAVPPGPPRSIAGSPESSSQPRDEGAISADASQASASAIDSKAPQQQQQPQQQPVCSLGQQFLQSYLDSLGSLNTFG